MTIDELLTALQPYPRDAEIGIFDADTMYALRINSVSMDKGVVLVGGNYRDVLDHDPCDLWAKK